MSDRKSYNELVTLSTFEERFEYLRLRGNVGRMTFGYKRNLNQRFYRSLEWQIVRNEVIVRDNACDLGVEGFDLYRVYIHHINPLSIKDVRNLSPNLLDTNNLICCSLKTHNAIHFGVDGSLIQNNHFATRKKGDTKLW